MNKTTPPRREHEIYKVTLTGSLVNLLLVAGKFMAGLVGNSAAMVADAVHSLSDLVTDIIVLAFVRIAGKPADKRHGYGHGKYETFATLLIGAGLFVVGAGILWSGCGQIYRFIGGEPLPAPGYIALGAAIASIASKELLFHYTRRAGVRTGSPAVVANAWHHRSDALSSIGTTIGVGGAVLLGPAWAVLDPLAAVVVSCFIAKVSIKLLVPCVDELLEKSLSRENEETIRQIILEEPGVSAPHHLRTRRIGNAVAIECHIRMDGGLSLVQAHTAASSIEQQLKRYFGSNAFISIHVEPLKPTDEAPRNPLTVS